MLLAVDVGNSHMVIGLFDNKNLLCDWRIQTSRGATADELAGRLLGLFQLANRCFAEVTGVIIGSVVPPMESVWGQLAKKYLNRQPLFVSGAAIDTGMPIRTDNPHEVGADRIINAVAAYSRYKKELIIVDFGTAITFDCVSAKGEYLGGAIAPGLRISFDALISKTSKLARIDISSPPAKAIGTSTETALQSGLLYGFGGMVEGLVSRISREFLPEIPKVIATGGMAGVIAPFAPSIEAVEPMLTLEGLQIIYARNS
ncbi:MAG: type III pantothenate kinase [Deltaproteobacteria bacterium]|nr:type III pantothenate kinase [Deltaproteobacteria bacterium]